MNSNFKFDHSKWDRASRNMASLAVKKEPAEVLKSHIKGVLKIIIGLTPPGKGGSADDAKSRGEAAILGDVRRIIQPMSADALAEFVALFGDERVEKFAHQGARALGDIRAKILSRDEMTPWHASRRRKDGRVMQINRDATTGLRKRDLLGLDVGLVSQADFQWFVTTLQKHVGFLASGWNAAAEALGLRMPPWIKRHGNSDGSFKLAMGEKSVRITIIHDGPFVDNVRGLHARVQRAFDYSERSLERQYEAALKRLARKAGFK